MHFEAKRKAQVFAEWLQSCPKVCDLHMYQPQPQASFKNTHNPLAEQ